MSPSPKGTLVAVKLPIGSSGSHFDAAGALGAAGFRTGLPVSYDELNIVSESLWS